MKHPQWLKCEHALQIFFHKTFLFSSLGADSCWWFVLSAITLKYSEVQFQIESLNLKLWKYWKIFYNWKVIGLKTQLPSEKFKDPYFGVLIVYRPPGDELKTDWKLAE